MQRNFQLFFTQPHFLIRRHVHIMRPLAVNFHFNQPKELKMRKIFWENPYQTKLTTTVASVAGTEVTFNETIAYCESGGQESDAATVNGLKILSSRMDKGAPHLIYYTLPAEHGLKVGDQASMEIDWARRSKLMRYHFCCELILVIVNRIFSHTPQGVELQPDDIDKSIKKVGAHMSDSGARVDFALDAISGYLKAIEDEFKRVINADLPIEKGYIDQANQVRFWRIPGYAMVPCGGTHVKSTAEVGHVTLKREKSSYTTQEIGEYSVITKTKHNAERIKIKLVQETPIKENTEQETIAISAAPAPSPSPSSSQ